MLTFRIAAARHHAAGEFVDDDDLVVADDIVLVLLEKLVRLQRIVDVMDDRDVFHVVERLALQKVCFAQKVFELFRAVFREVGRALFFIDLVIFRRQQRNEPVDGVVEIRAVIERAGNDQRRTGFIDEDRIDFIDDREEVSALDHLVALVLHVVAQIIEAEFVVGRVSDGRRHRRRGAGRRSGRGR